MLGYAGRPNNLDPLPRWLIARFLLGEAIDGGLMLNLSGNNPSHADVLADLDLAPAVTILPMPMRADAPTQIARARQEGVGGDDR
jgi:hypothetical protein